MMSWIARVGLDPTVAVGDGVVAPVPSGAEEHAPNASRITNATERAGFATSGVEPRGRSQSNGLSKPGVFVRRRGPGGGWQTIERDCTGHRVDLRPAEAACYVPIDHAGG